MEQVPHVLIKEEIPEEADLNFASFKELPEGRCTMDHVSIKEEIVKHEGFEQFFTEKFENVKGQLNTELIIKNEFINESVLEHEPNPNRVKTFPCDFCDEIFTEQYSLMVHKLSHNVEKSFSCECCGKKFSHSKYLIKHERMHSKRVPTRDRSYSCHDCDKTFIRKNSLVEHKRNNHSDKKFPCNLCSKSFTYESSLTIHKQSHKVNHKIYNQNSKLQV